MASKRIMEYYDAVEVEKEIGVLAEECYFSEDIPAGGFATLYCDDVTLQGLYQIIQPEAANEIKWINYFRSLGYYNEVLIRVY